MQSKKIIIPILLLSVGVGVYFYFGSSNRDSSNKNIELVEAMQVDKNGNSKTIDLLKETPKARDKDGKVVKLQDMPEETKKIVGELRIIQNELGEYLSQSREEEKVFEGEDAILDAKLAKLDVELEKINKIEGIDGDAIKTEITAMLDAPLNDEDMPKELAESLNKTDATLLELEESFDKLKEEI